MDTYENSGFAPYAVQSEKLMIDKFKKMIHFATYDATVQKRVLNTFRLVIESTYLGFSDKIIQLSE